MALSAPMLVLHQRRERVGLLSNYANVPELSLPFFSSREVFVNFRHLSSFREEVAFAKKQTPLTFPTLPLGNCVGGKMMMKTFIILPSTHKGPKYAYPQPLEKCTRLLITHITNLPTNRPRQRHHWQCSLPSSPLTTAEANTAPRAAYAKMETNKKGNALHDEGNKKKKRVGERKEMEGTEEST